MALPRTSKVRLLLICLALTVAGCKGGDSGTTFIRKSGGAIPFQAPGTDPWELVWTDAGTASPALLWNGLIGVRIGPTGTALDGKGHPLPSFAIDEYDTSGEEKIRPLPNPLLVSIQVGDQVLGSQPTEGWRQRLNLRTGLLTTEWAETLSEGGEVSIKSEVVLHPRQRILGERWTLSTSKASPIIIRCAFAGDTQQARKWEGDATTYGPSNTRVRSQQMIHGGSSDPRVTPEGNGLRLDQVSSLAGKPLVFERTLFIGESPNELKMFPPLGLEIKETSAAELRKVATGKWIVVPPPPPEFEQLLDQATRRRGEEWKTDIEIDGPVEDQQAVRSFLFYLRSGIHPEGKMSISPMGLSSDTYNGHVFWDADVWVFPALAFIDPSSAAGIPRYRTLTTHAAYENYGRWGSQGRPTADPSYHPAGVVRPINGLSAGLKYPWESSVTGRETARGPSQFEDHITGTVAFAMGMAGALGLADPSSVQAAVNGALTFYLERSEGAPGVAPQINRLMSPDENHIGDNDLYTNLLAQWCMNGGTWTLDATRPPIQWVLPKDAKSFLTYDNDRVKSYKQAAAVLAIYPLQYPPAEAQAKVMMDRFADKVIKNGPAMTDSVHALIWARLGETDKAYDTWRKGWMEFVRPPFLLFSEKRGQDRTYFTTGAAGELQTVIYGFLGFRIDSKQQAGAAWSLKLKGDRWLSIKPNLPKAWNRVTFRNFHVLGKSYTLTATHQSVQVTQGE